MFTGIVSSLGTVLSIEHQPTSSAVRIQSDYDDLTLGESVAVNGVCLTVTETNDKESLYFVSSETLEKTNLGSFMAGDIVNLERSLRVGDRLSGHWVQGHVDGVGTLHQIKEVDENHFIQVRVSDELADYLVTKGSITVDGVSLTVNSILPSASQSEPGQIAEICLIPHTWNHTRFSKIKTGALINIEVDILSKYTEKHVEKLWQSKRQNN